MSNLKLLVLATALPIALGFELPLVPSRVTARACHSPNQRAAELILMKTEASKSEAAELDEGQCFLIDTDEGYVPNPSLSLSIHHQRMHSALSRPGRRKYVCTEDPAELAWMLGIDVATLTSGPKSDDLELVECHEDWSHTGTPQWACSEDGPREDETTSPAPQPCQSPHGLQQLWHWCSPGGHSTAREPRPLPRGYPLDPIGRGGGGKGGGRRLGAKQGLRQRSGALPKVADSLPLAIQTPRKFQPLRILTNPLRKAKSEAADPEAA